MMGDVLQWPGGRHLGNLDTVLITKAQAAAFLGVGERTLDRYMKATPPPPSHRVGNRLYFRRAELSAWLAARHRARHT